MLETLLDLALEENKWLPVSFGVALATLLACWLGDRRQTAPRAHRTQHALHLMYGGVIGTMGSGHLVAVGIKLGQGTLVGPTFLLILLGLGLAGPAYALVALTLAERRRRAAPGRAAVALNLWLAAFLLALGLHNLPLAVPGVLNVVHQSQHAARPLLGRTILVLVSAGYALLFVGSLVFAASGQSFETFRGFSS